MSAIEVIERPETAAAALDPVRSRLLAELSTPASAAAVAGRLGLPRQKVNYHLRTLEAHGLLRVAEERAWGGLTERVLMASADGFLVSPTALGDAGATPARTQDRMSAAYLVALAGRVVREVGGLMKRAEATGKRLATASVDSEIRFRTPADRAAFADELTRAVAGLAAKYHAGPEDGGRTHRLFVALHPTPDEPS